MTLLKRETRETRILLRLDVAADDAASAGGPGSVGDPRGETPTAAGIVTTDAFLDHMLGTLARYAGVRLEVDAAGDLRHHLVEDVAIALGLALRRETPAACARFGEATVPMDDALVQAAIDLGGRFWYQGPLPSPLYDHFMRSLAENAGLTLHLRVLRGRDRHHVVEAAMKALGLALRSALRPEGSVFSTKGAIQVTFEEDA
jgi:imidazoleglycerol-phosphate dehydratase